MSQKEVSAIVDRAVAACLPQESFEIIKTKLGAGIFNHLRVYGAHDSVLSRVEPAIFHAVVSRFNELSSMELMGNGIAYKLMKSMISVIQSNATGSESELNQQLLSTLALDHKKEAGADNGQAAGSKRKLDEYLATDGSDSGSLSSSLTSSSSSVVSSDSAPTASASVRPSKFKASLKASDSANEMNTKVAFQGLLEDLDDHALKVLFQDCGLIVGISKTYLPPICGGGFSGHGFLTFATHGQAQKAVRMFDQRWVGLGRLRVQWAPVGETNTTIVGSGPDKVAGGSAVDAGSNSVSGSGKKTYQDTADVGERPAKKAKKHKGGKAKKVGAAEEIDDKQAGLGKKKDKKKKGKGKKDKSHKS